MSHETSPTVHRKVDGIEINIKVFYRLAIFVIILEILMFAIVLMARFLSYLSNALPAQPMFAKVGWAVLRPEHFYRRFYLVSTITNINISIIIIEYC